jgi:hypothetical protein
MANPLDKIKKLKGRSLKEIQTRGGQAVSAYSEQIGLRGGLISDIDLMGALRKGAFAPSIQVTPEILFDQFFTNSADCFFPSLANIRETADVFEKRFGLSAARQFVDQADKVLAGRHDILGYLNLDFGKPVDWHYEPVSETQCPVRHWKQYDELNSRETGDKKVIWELNRHSHFFVLGVAFQLTGDEKYAICFVEQILGWMEQNPPGMGVNWVSSLEIAFRSMSWIWAFNLFNGSQAFTSDVFMKALKHLYAHARHIEKYLSTYYSPNTHLTGEALGLYYIGTQLAFLERAQIWRDLGEKILMEEIDRQIRPDGVHFEQSTWYQKYTTDFYIHFLILQKLNGESLEKKDRTKLAETVRMLLDCQMYFTRPDGSSPLIGDDDGGKLLPISNDASDDFRGSLAVGAVIFERGDYKWVAGEPKQDLLWLLGSKGLSVYDAVPTFHPKQNSRAFENGGFFVMRDGWKEEDNYLVIDAGPVGSLKGGHGHADTLSFELAVAGRTMLIDSGTYTYHKSKESRDYYRSSAAHNTLTIDGQPSSKFGDIFSWETMAEPELHSWISQDRFDFFEASHNGYKHLENSPANSTRSILFLKNEYWIMRDFVKTVGQHEYQQNFHFDPDSCPSIERVDDGQWCVNEAAKDSETTGSGKERKVGFQNVTAKEKARRSLDMCRRVSARRNFSHL